MPWSGLESIPFRVGKNGHLENQFTMGLHFGFTVEESQIKPLSLVGLRFVLTTLSAFEFPLCVVYVQRTPVAPENISRNPKAYLHLNTLLDSEGNPIATVCMLPVQFVVHPSMSHTREACFDRNLRLSLTNSLSLLSRYSMLLLLSMPSNHIMLE